MCFALTRSCCGCMYHTNFAFLIFVVEIESHKACNSEPPHVSVIFTGIILNIRFRVWLNVDRSHPPWGWRSGNSAPNIIKQPFVLLLVSLNLFYKGKSAKFMWATDILHLITLSLASLFQSSRLRGGKLNYIWVFCRWCPTKISIQR